MLGFLFLVIIDLVMQQTVKEERTRIRWDFTTMLEILDYVDDIALLPSIMNYLQCKTTKLEENSAKVGLKLNAKKSISKSLALSALLQTEEEQIDFFLTKYLRVQWQQRIPDLTLLKTAETSNISGEIRRRRGNWIGHILRKVPADDCAVALRWKPEERSKRGRLKPKWRRIVAVERKGWNSLNVARREASDRNLWKANVHPLSYVPPGMERFKVKVRYIWNK